MSRIGGKVAPKTKRWYKDVGLGFKTPSGESMSHCVQVFFKREELGMGLEARNGIAKDCKAWHVPGSLPRDLEWIFVVHATWLQPILRFSSRQNLRAA